jgi:hypothetical protein
MILISKLEGQRWRPLTAHRKVGQKGSSCPEHLLQIERQALKEAVGDRARQKPRDPTQGFW